MSPEETRARSDGQPAPGGFALEVYDVSKTYRLYAKPVDRLTEALLRRPRHREFTALADISFTVPTAGIVGIIGENGAGKTTLLKILAGTLTPSSGRVVSHGRVAALLELGAGFHPEFTGRQNIHLNASLLGLTNEEIRDREARIIEFSELGGFIDRPVKTYSTGMHVRLGFSIATSVDPDILIVDEALSVGDEHFQRKCIRRMDEFRSNGKAILFCSHGLFLVREICVEVIWLANGRIQRRGAPADVIGAYLEHLEMKERPVSAAGPAVTPPSALPEVTIEEVTLLDGSDKPLERFEQARAVALRIQTACRAQPVKGHLAIALIAPDRRLVFVTTTKADGLPPLVFSGRQTMTLHIPSFPLNSGRYSIKAFVGDESALRVFDERETPLLSVTSDRPELGMVAVAHEWKFSS